MLRATKAIVLFGSPGSGKGTQAAFLSSCLKVPHISTGDMLRERVQANSSSGTAFAATMHAGALVADEVVNRMVEERLARPDCANGFILDGYPRTRDQAVALIHWMDQRSIREVVIHLIVDYNIIIKRLTGRRQCPRCGTLYNMKSHAPRVEGVCDLDGEKLIVREDDQESVIRERLDTYEKQTQPLLAFFREQGRRLVEVNADHVTPEALSQEICGLITVDSVSE
jgi:adenylate kinase